MMLYFAVSCWNVSSNPGDIRRSRTVGSFCLLPMIQAGDPCCQRSRGCGTGGAAAAERRDSLAMTVDGARTAAAQRRCTGHAGAADDGVSAAGYLSPDGLDVDWQRAWMFDGPAMVEVASTRRRGG